MSNANKLFAPSFGIWDSNRNLKPGIHCAFLAKESIDFKVFNGFLKDAKGRAYKVHFDFNVDAVILPEDGILNCIISYQQRVEGAFAVVRILYEHKKPDMKDKAKQKKAAAQQEN